MIVPVIASELGVPSDVYFLSALLSLCSLARGPGGLRECL